MSIPQTVVAEAREKLLAGGWREENPALVVWGQGQRLFAMDHRGVVAVWPVSTARTGFGNRENSGCTPPGLHRIHACYGEGQPLGAVFKSRQPTGEVVPESREAPRDLITTRILWLEGLEEGCNRGPGIDSRERYIYIHGTDDVARLGQPVSAGCVRMHPEHIAALYEQVDTATLVLILSAENAQPTSRKDLRNGQPVENVDLAPG
ncbi:MAG: L,D-transpeptidase [Magnetococcales bacterium]|nr:L,D-transpeptidase [Magnetococcales bacterium]